MTFNELVEKSQNNSGAYSVVEAWLEDLKDGIKKKDKTNIINQLCDERNIQERYGNLSGFFWGLYAAGVISNEDRDALENELFNMYVSLNREREQNHGICT